MALLWQKTMPFEADLFVWLDVKIMYFFPWQLWNGLDTYYMENFQNTDNSYSQIY